MENEFYFSEKFTKSQAWLDLLLLASYKERTVFIRGIEIKLIAGELCYSQLTLSKRWKWSDKTVKKFLDLLVLRKMIAYTGGKVTTIISILNWSKYQNSTEQNPSVKSRLSLSYNDMDSEQLSELTPNNFRTNKKEKNIKKVKNPLTGITENLTQNLLDVFIEEHLEVKGYPYSLIDKENESKFIEKLLAHYKSENGNFSNESCMTDFRTFFKGCLQINDKWLKENMNPRTIVSQFNRIKNIVGKLDQRATAYNIAQIINSHFPTN